MRSLASIAPCLLAVSLLLLSALPALRLAAEEPAASVPTTRALPAMKPPILITDIGQGNTGKLIEVMLSRQKVADTKLENLAKAESLDGVGTLIVGVGASTKGLGAAGLDVATEMERAKALLAGAKARGIPVIGVHIGGEARRGELSDAFNRLVAESSDVLVVWSGGDTDGFFRKIAAEKDIPLEVIDGKQKAGEKIAELMGNTQAQETPAAPAPTTTAPATTAS